ncbi:hypothetical protein MRX96_019035 [Rhipicephalus microplus]
MNYDGRRTGGGAKVRSPFDSSAHWGRPMNGSETPLGRPCIIGVYRLRRHGARRCAEEGRPLFPERRRCTLPAKNNLPAKMSAFNRPEE